MNPVAEQTHLHHTTPMSSMVSLKNHFLIAMPALHDPNFNQSISLICEHNEEGAMGVIINRQSDITVKEIVTQFSDNTRFATEDDEHLYAFEGGPVYPQHGFVLHRNQGEWTYSLNISDELTLTTSQDIMKAIGDNEGPDEYLIALGYAGWEAGQLEQEISDNSWLTIPACADIVFHYPISERRSLAAIMNGINLEKLSSLAGHA